MDRISEVNYKIKLVGSSTKATIVHHNRLESYYGTPQQVTPTSTNAAPPVSSVPLYSDVVWCPMWLQQAAILAHQYLILVSVNRIAVVDHQPAMVTTWPIDL